MEHLPFHVMQIAERVNLKPSQMDNNIEMHIASAAQVKLEGKCSKHGFIRPNSVIVVSRSLGHHKGSHFHGELTFEVEVVADVCRPLRGDLIFCTVVNLNRMGLLAKAGDFGANQHVLQIYVVLQHHNNAEFFADSNLTEGASISVSVIGSKYRLKDDQIIVIGKITQVFAGDSLHDYSDKIIRLPSSESNTPLRIESAQRHPEPSTQFGHELYIQSLKASLGSAQREVRDCLKLADDSDDAYLERKWGRILGLARSMTNEFELVSPPHFYEADPPVSIYKPLNRAFFKMWEMIVDFQLLDYPKVGRLVTAHTAECPGSFVEAILKYREGGEDDKINHTDQAFVMSLVKPTQSAPGTPASDTITRLTDQYPNVTVIQGGELGRPCPTGYKKRQGDLTGDLFKLGNILDFAADVQASGGADLVTSDLGFDFDEVEDVREQCMLFPLFAEVTSILHCQKKGGHSVLKVFDIFTKMTAKIICFLSGFYKEAYLTKPYTSRSGNPEKYLICKHFEGISKKQLVEVDKAFEEWTGIEKFVGAQYLHNQSFVADLPAVTLSQ